MRAVWVNYPADPDYMKLAAYQITDVYFDGRWLAAKGPAASLAYLKGVQAKGLNPGVFLCSQGQDQLAAWPSPASMTATAWADWAYDLVQHKIAPGTGGDFPKVSLNVEQHNPVWIQGMLARWRAHSPKRWTSWAMEGHQTGWMTPDFVTALVNLNLNAIHPEAFTGNMLRNESDRVVLEMVKAGFPADLLFCVLDGSQLGSNWQGVAFTQGRLP